MSSIVPIYVNKGNINVINPPGALLEHLRFHALCAVYSQELNQYIKYLLESFRALEDNMSIVIKNKKAHYDYFVIERLEAGIALAGSEVKSIRAGRANLKDSFVRIINGEAFIFGAHVTYNHTINPYFKPDEKRPRKLLLHRKQIDKLAGQVSKKDLSIIPLQIHFNKKGYAKLIIALCKGKKEYDKRETIKQREAKREAQSAIKNWKS